MLTTNIAQSTFRVQPATTVYEYSFSLFNPEDNDLQDNLTAAFPSIPTADDWAAWLSGWNSCGYSLSTTPQLINII
ncbi:MAG: hypothetical protein ACRC1Z_13625 [Waterburya sp.]